MKLSKGFTLIELIVVMAVFLFIIGAAVSIFISIVQHQKRVLSEQQVLNQISYVEEYMSKALRMAKAATTNFDANCLGEDNLGYIYLLMRHPSGSTYNGIKFINQSDVDSLGNPSCQEFFLDTDGILKEIKNNSAAVALTPSGLQINSIRFAVNGLDGSVIGQGCTDNPDQCGASETDTVQPRVTILLNVKISGDSQEPERIIQTTVSERNLNVK